MSRIVYFKGHCGVYARLTVELKTLIEENFECQDTFIK